MLQIPEQKLKGLLMEDKLVSETDFDAISEAKRLGQCSEYLGSLPILIMNLLSSILTCQWPILRLVV